MSKIAFVDTADAAGLRTQGDKLFLRQGTIFRRRRHKPPPGFRKHPSKKLWLRSEKRSEVNALAREIGDHWATLSQSQKNEWELYAAYFDNYKNGYSAFYGNNMRLQRAGHVCFGWVDDISVPPGAIDVPTGICVQFITVSAAFCVTWATPNCVSLFVQCFEWIPPGLRRSRDYRWKYVETAYSLDASLMVPLTFLDTGRQAVLALRTTTLQGEISEHALPGTFTKQSQQRSSYGYVYYGYAFYGEE